MVTNTGSENDGPCTSSSLDTDENAASDSKFQEETRNEFQTSTKLPQDQLRSLFYETFANGRPMTDRNQTIEITKALMGVNETNEANVKKSKGSKTIVPEDNSNQQQRPPLSNVYGQGPWFVSDIPVSCTQSNEAIVVGIDEAGRGSVLGPMVYGAAFWSLSDFENKISTAGCWTDSKKLTEIKRFDLMDNVILQNAEIGFAFRVIHAGEISRNMTRSIPYNLNQMSHDAAMGIIHKLIHAGLNIDTCYVDTVGIAQNYQCKLENEFKDFNIKFVVESKADDKYAPCSAASIVAKVIRDRILENWQYSEPLLRSDVTKDYGSGYPSDPICKKWLEGTLEPIFGYPDVVRFSWAPTKTLLEKFATQVKFAADVDCDDHDDSSTMDINMLKRQRELMQSFLKTDKSKRRKPLPFFRRKCLHMVDNL